MTDHDQAYYAALQLCGERYREMLRHNVGVGRDKQITLSQFVGEFNHACRERTVPIPKLCRWLGYIQGVLIEWGVTSVDVERDWTRPLFRPLDYPAASCEHEPSRQALKDIDALISNGDRHTVNERNAFEHFTALNRLLLNVRDIARRALSSQEPK